MATGAGQDAAASELCASGGALEPASFWSHASNLVSGDTNGFPDLFARDRQTGTTERVSLSLAGAQGNGFSYQPALSADGRLVAFMSAASNLVSDDANGRYDVFARGPFDWPLFADGFESGTTSAWSITQP